MADSAVKKLLEAVQEVATWAATGRDHYRMMYDPAKNLADKLRSAKDDDPNVAAMVSRALVEIAKPRPYLGDIAAGLDNELKNLAKAKAAFEKAAKAKKK